MGIAHSNLKNCFAKLVHKGSNGISSPDSSSTIDTEMGTKDDKNGDGTGDQDEYKNETSMNEDNPINNASYASEQQSASKPSSQSLRTKLWLPQSLRRCLLLKYTRAQLSENDDDDVLPEEIDEDEIQRELEEEERFDVRDLLASRVYEAGLWAP